MKSALRLSVFACTLATSAVFAQQPAPPSHEGCRDCGVVESVHKEMRTDKAKGIAGTPVTPGMAVGGVVGGVLGNQLGGHGAGTVLGAAGGAYAGHEIERKGRQYAVYVMHVRMADGSTRTIEQRTAISRGSHVVVEGRTARLERGAPRQG